MMVDNGGIMVDFSHRYFASPPFLQIPPWRNRRLKCCLSSARLRKTQPRSSGGRWVPGRWCSPKIRIIIVSIAGAMHINANAKKHIEIYSLKIIMIIIMMMIIIIMTIIIIIIIIIIQSLLQHLPKLTGSPAVPNSRTSLVPRCLGPEWNRPGMKRNLGLAWKIGAMQTKHMCTKTRPADDVFVLISVEISPTKMGMEMENPEGHPGYCKFCSFHWCPECSMR